MCQWIRYPASCSTSVMQKHCTSKLEVVRAVVLRLPAITGSDKPMGIPINLVLFHSKNLGLGRSMYSPEQLEEFARFQESQGT